MSSPGIGNLDRCIEDARDAAMDQDVGPADILEFNALRGHLQAVRARIPSLYVETAYAPYVEKLDSLGESGFNEILLADPSREREAGLMLDIAHAFLQRGERFEPKALAAFQEVVADLYDGFLSAEDRRGVLPPERETIAPMVKFGNPSFGPYTFSVDATEIFGLQVGVVSIPPANARRGLLAWAALGHETAGHDILHADTGLLQETSSAVREALAAEPRTKALASYWADRIDETASDVLGILNMGPAPAIGLIGYFRGLNAAFTGVARLRNECPAGDPHPADIVRGYLAAATVAQLKFAGAQAWAKVIADETQRDVTAIRLAGRQVAPDVARLSAEIVATTIVTHRMAALEHHGFGEIQNWRDEDEDIVDQLRGTLTTANPLRAELTTGVYAAHLVAAATVTAVDAGGNVGQLFRRMLDLLKSMHDVNPTFGSLRVRHPGNLSRDRAYVPLPTLVPHDDPGIRAAS